MMMKDYRKDGVKADVTNSDAEEDIEEEDNNNFEGLQMPQRKIKEPAVVCELADRVEGEGPKFKRCKKIYKCA